MLMGTQHVVRLFAFMFLMFRFSSFLLLQECMNCIPGFWVVHAQLAMCEDGKMGSQFAHLLSGHYPWCWSHIGNNPCQAWHKVQTVIWSSNCSRLTWWHVSHWYRGSGRKSWLIGAVCHWVITGLQLHTAPYKLHRKHVKRTTVYLD